MAAKSGSSTTAPPACTAEHWPNVFPDDFGGRAGPVPPIASAASLDLSQPQNRCLKLR
jgi:hypothetical protein